MKDRYFLFAIAQWLDHGFSSALNKVDKDSSRKPVGHGRRPLLRLLLLRHHSMRVDALCDGHQQRLLVLAAVLLWQTRCRKTATAPFLTTI
jgi:hypothetical protein